MKKINFYILFLLISSLMLSCTNDSTEDLTEPIDLVNYNENIKAVIDQNCTGCHNDPPVAGAPMPLLTYDQVREAVENRKLINKISTDSPDSGSRMPLGGPALEENVIALFEQWAEDGLPENNSEN